MAESVIPDKAVEAAVASFFAGFPRVHQQSKDDLRAALEAAAPHMLADAWDAGHSSGYAEGADVDLMIQETPNPYRTAK